MAAVGGRCVGGNGRMRRKRQRRWGFLKMHTRRTKEEKKGCEEGRSYRERSNGLILDVGNIGRSQNPLLLHRFSTWLGEHFWWALVRFFYINKRKKIIYEITIIED